MDSEMAQETAPETQRGPGRPPIITLAVVEKVAQLIAKGMTEEQACTRVGVNHSSLRTARHRNPEIETVIKRAQAEFLDESLDYIAAGKRGWQGRAWILERRHGDQFRRTTGMELNAQVGPFSPADLLDKKPLASWTRADVDLSLGCWRLIRRWSREKLEQLSARYDLEWGPMDKWTDEQLEWSVAIGKRVDELANENGQGEQINVIAEDSESRLDDAEQGTTSSDGGSDRWNRPDLRG
jgi:hypothetical protein